jgi:hypothetical protein
MMDDIHGELTIQLVDGRHPNASWLTNASEGKHSSLALCNTPNVEEAHITVVRAE